MEKISKMIDNTSLAAVDPMNTFAGQFEIETAGLDLAAQIKEAERRMAMNAMLDDMNRWRCSALEKAVTPIYITKKDPETDEREFVRLNPGRNMMFMAEPDLNELLETMGEPKIKEERTIDMKKFKKITIECEDGSTYVGEIKRIESSPFAYDQFCVEAIVKDQIKGVCGIKEVVFANPATIVKWTDGTQTIVCCQDNIKTTTKTVKEIVNGKEVEKKVSKKKPMACDTYSEEIGLAMCIVKKWAGNDGGYNKVFKEFIKEDAQ